MINPFEKIASVNSLDAGLPEYSAYMMIPASASNELTPIYKNKSAYSDRRTVSVIEIVFCLFIIREIRRHLQWQEEGWGRMKASAVIKEMKWDTAIWFDKKRDTYLLPIKSDVRLKASLSTGDVLNVSIFI